jgi:hypothetical protein
LDTNKIALDVKNLFFVHGPPRGSIWHVEQGSGIRMSLGLTFMAWGAY